MKKIPTIVAGIALILYLISCPNWERRLMNNAPSLIGAFSRVFTPADDLYDPLFSLPIDLGKKSQVKATAVTHFYRGLYGIFLVPESRTGRTDQRLFFRNATLTLQCTVEVFINGKAVSAVAILPDDLSETSIDICVWSYWCPEDLPRMVPIDFILTITTPEPGLVEEFGDWTFRVKKISEE